MAGMSKAEFERRKKEYAAILARPAEEIRAGAVRQRDAFRKKLDELVSRGPRTRFYFEQLQGIDQQIKWGDELKDSDKEADRIQRRRFYARALFNGQDAALELDAEIKEFGVARIALTDMFSGLGEETFEPITTDAGKAKDAAVDAVNAALNKAGAVIGDIGATAQNTVYILAGGLALAAVAYAYSRGSGGRR